MKVLLTLCAVVAAASAGTISWPGATVVTAPASIVKTVVPGETKAFGFSTTQYINAVPSGLHLAYQPQVSYHVPQFSAISPVQHTFIPVPGATYYPSTVFYPSHPGFIPAVPSAPFPGPSIIPPQLSPPIQDQPSSPPQPAGDADTAVVDSADIPPQEQNSEEKQQAPTTEKPQQDQPSAPQSPPASTFPNFPQIPQGSSDAPSFPSLPQYPQQSEIPSFPSLPQIPQQVQAPLFPGFPQFPQGQAPSYPGLPQFPQIPSFPQFPGLPSNPNIPQSPLPSPPSSYPGEASGDKGLNDEDTISVESA